MEAFIHYLYGNDEETQNHYAQKQYRDDVILEIDKVFYEVYFYGEGNIKYEFTKDGFFSFPGMIVLDYITTERIQIALDRLIDHKYFECFKGHKELPVNNRFINNWYVNDLNFTKSAMYSVYKLR